MNNEYTKILSNVSNDKSFKTEFGELKSLKDLSYQLKDKGRLFYDNYVNQDENHFANWIENVFDDKELAKSLRSAKNYEKAMKLLTNRINYAKLWLSFNKDKEKINNYLVNQVYSGYVNNINFHPSFQKFETLTNFDPDESEKPIIRPLLEPPKLTNVPDLIQNAGKPEILPPKFEVKDPPIKQIEHKPDEQDLLKDLEDQIPGLDTAPKPVRRGFLKLFFR